MLSIGAAPITGYDPSQYGGVCAPLQYSVAFASHRAVALWPIIVVRCRVRSVACGVACSPWAAPYASTNWLGRHQAGPSFVFIGLHRCLLTPILPLRSSAFPEGAPLRFEVVLCRFELFAGEGTSLALPLWLARSSVPQQGGFPAAQLNCVLSELARSLQVGLPARER